MASLYKKPITRTDPKTGEKVKAKSRKWWGRYRDENGVERRVPLATDKTAAQTMLNEKVKQAERRAAGIDDPFEKQRKRPISAHIEEFGQHLRDKGNTDQHVGEVTTKVRKIASGCKWKYICDFAPSEVQRFLADLRNSGLSVQTSNHYLRAVKQFSRWLVRDRRSNDDPLAHLAMMNVKIDRRHDRRALSADEFVRLIEAAEAGPPIETISGTDRANMYALAGWTGYRKNEIGSLTRDSLRLDDDPPTAIVQAAYSKRKRQDAQVLHPAVVERLKSWLSSKPSLPSNELLFPVSGKVPGGKERKTAKMMRLDLEEARRRWIDDATTDAERTQRMNSDFLTYRDSAGRYADFHSNRHTFITTLERARISPRTAQSLARHSDIRLTMGVYTHIEIHDQQAAIESLPAPPLRCPDNEEGQQVVRATGTDSADSVESVVPILVPRSAENGAVRLAPTVDQTALNCTTIAKDGEAESDQAVAATSPDVSTLGAGLHSAASQCTAKMCDEIKIRPTRFERVTFGSVDRCSIQLSYGRKAR